MTLIEVNGCAVHCLEDALERMLGAVNSIDLHFVSTGTALAAAPDEHGESVVTLRLPTELVGTVRQRAQSHPKSHQGAVTWFPWGLRLWEVQRNALEVTMVLEGWVAGSPASARSAALSPCVGMALSKVRCDDDDEALAVSCIDDAIRARAL
eukprot:gene33689-35683_t